MYLPCWTDGLSFREQHYAYRIAEEYEKALENETGLSFYSLLPIRFFTDSYYNGFYDLHSVGTYQDGYELCRTSRIRHSNVEFAFQIWETAAEIIRREYPEIENCSFDGQLFNGIYPIHFAYSLDEIKNRQIEIMKELINNGFTVNEYLTVSYSQEQGRKTWHYQGIVGDSSFECDKVFYRTPHGEMMPLTLRKNVSYTYEECEKYYLSFDEKILMLGNQVRAYYSMQEANKPLFDAIKEMNIEKVREFIGNGYSLNAIDINGDSAFTKILNSFFNDEEKEGWDDIDTEETELLDSLFETGVNPAIYGVNAYGCSLDAAVVCHRNKTAKWLLEKGVNPVFFPCIDDLYDEDVTLVDWLESIIYEEMQDEPEKNHDDTDEMLQMLKEYS